MSFTVFPAIDLRRGNVVRLQEGDLARAITYSAEPRRVARRWVEAGADWLHVVNLDGALGEEDDLNRSALKSILKLGRRVQFGGGLRSLEAVRRAIDLGVSRVVLGTAAVENPHVVKEALNEFGVGKIVVAMDARDGLVRVRGWRQASSVFATDLARQMRTLGLRTLIFTDVSRDGLGRGLNIASTRELAEISGLDVIASGGVHALEDVIAARQAGLAGVIIGRALYERTIDLKAAL
jgi:phosphoribosylformimino-5-aminoimidazole carboxamide ribotide isomerase